MKTPSEYIQIITDMEQAIYETGVVLDIGYKAPYVIVHFSEVLGGLNGIRMHFNTNRGKALKIILDRIQKLQEKDSMFKEAR